MPLGQSVLRLRASVLSDITNSGLTNQLVFIPISQEQHIVVRVSITLL